MFSNTFFRVVGGGAPIQVFPGAFSFLVKCSVVVNDSY